jgi:hypothetical protein
MKEVALKLVLEVLKFGGGGNPEKRELRTSMKVV